MSHIKYFFEAVAELELNFFNFLRSLFELENSKVIGVDDPQPGWQRRGPDLVVLEPDGVTKTVVELKLYRTRVSTSLMERAARRLLLHKDQEQAQRAILVVTCRVSDHQRARIETDDLKLWDSESLVQKVAGHTTLAQELGNLLRATQVESIGQLSQLNALSEMLIETAVPKLGAGEILAQKLEASLPGKAEKAASQFESLCLEALRLLFGESFAGWKKQAPVGRGYHRLDLVARLVATQSFWGTIAHDFNARYVVFEFKNYKAPITQDEIYSTEKYLFLAALRPVAIIVARGGDNESARRTMRGALREQGKLIICISLGELCALLRGFDAGEDAANLLYEKLDGMLVSIAR
jgi:hypothetical protein